MRLSIVVVGRVRELLRKSVGEFESRAGRYWKLEVVEVDAGTGRGGDPDADTVRAAEAERLLARIPERAEVWALTRPGKQVASTELARELGRRALQSSEGVAFVIGGAYGLGPVLLERASRRFSLSRLTLPHELARLVLAEQLYRAGTILRSEPYHKGDT